MTQFESTSQPSRYGGRAAFNGTTPFQTPPATVIYARPGGSDTTGVGSVDSPYATFQRAIREVPPIPAPGASYIIDITGIGIEELPPQYCLPNIQFPTLAYENDTSIPYFYSGAGLRIRALPQLASSLPAADAVINGTAGAIITTDPDTNLITLTITTPRPSWTNGALRNKQVIRTLGSYLAGCVIIDATTTTLVLTNNANKFNGGNGPLVLEPGEVLQIVEPSATLATSPVYVPIDVHGNAFGAMVSTCNSIAFQGIKFTQTDAEDGFPVAFASMNCPEAPMELCDIEGINGQGATGSYWLYLNGCVVRANVLSVSCSMFTENCHFDTITLFYIAESTPQSYTECAFSGCASYASVDQHGLPIVNNSVFNNCLVRDSVIGFSSSPTGDGFYLLEGRFQLTNVKIENAAGNGIRLAGSNSKAVLTHVTGVNLGEYGILAEEGAQASADVTTDVTGTTGAPSTDTKSGSLAGTTYAQVAAGLAYDIPPTANIAFATGSRIFTK